METEFASSKYPKAKKPKDVVSYRENEHCKAKYTRCPICGHKVAIRYIKTHKCER